MYIRRDSLERNLFLFELGLLIMLLLLATKVSCQDACEQPTLLRLNNFALITLQLLLHTCLELFDLALCCLVGAIEFG